MKRAVKMTAAPGSIVAGDATPDSGLPVLLGVENFSMRHPAWTVSSLRNLVWRANDRLNSKGIKIPGNGLAPAIVRIGRKLLIDEKKFFAWIESQTAPMKGGK